LVLCCKSYRSWMDISYCGNCFRHLPHAIFLIHAYTHTQTHTHTHSLSLSLSLSHTHTHTHTHTHKYHCCSTHQLDALCLLFVSVLCFTDTRSEERRVGKECR